VLNPYEIAIGDTSAFGEYAGRGIMAQLHRRRTLSFRALQDELDSPTCMVVDFAKMTRPQQITLAVRAYHAFTAQVQAEIGINASGKNFYLLYLTHTPPRPRHSRCSLVENPTPGTAVTPTRSFPSVTRSRSPLGWTRWAM
jgi:SpoVK/Ycf46/Vps4 family AAA+-type ATPase